MRHLVSALMIGALSISTVATADHNDHHENARFYHKAPLAHYEVTITNITPSQSFTPQLVVTHRKDARLFSLGEPASDALEQLAEGGATAPLTDALSGASFAAQTIDGLLGPGQSASVKIKGHLRGNISVAAMMLPTNDNFIALNSVSLPYFGSVTHLVPAYDAGTEYNDQSCQHIPGPRCGGEAVSEPSDTDEGFVHISSGFQERGTTDADGFEVLSPSDYDWRNPVAKITIRRIR